MSRAEYRFRALGTICEVILYRASWDTDALFARIFREISDFEQECSRFLGHSKLSILNHTGVAEVSDRFLRILSLSRSLFLETGGFFNPLCDIRTAGYTLTFDSGIFSERRADHRYDMGEISVSGNCVILPQGAYLDFGAIGKWFIAQEISKMLLESWYSDFIVNLGGDIVAHGRNTEGEIPRAGITSPFASGILGSVELPSCAIATSGSYLRRWVGENGSMRHHLKNPYEDAQESRIISLSVIHPDAARADALATALFVMGEDRAFSFARKHGIDMLVLFSDASLRMTDGFEKKYGLLMPNHNNSPLI